MGMLRTRNVGDPGINLVTMNHNSMQHPSSHTVAEQSNNFLDTFDEVVPFSFCPSEDEGIVLSNSAAASTLTNVEGASDKINMLQPPNSCISPGLCTLFGVDGASPPSTLFPPPASSGEASDWSSVVIPNEPSVMR